MNPLDAFFHGANFLAPAVFVGVVVPLLARLIWWRERRGVPLGRSIAWASAASVLVLVIGLFVFGRDGKMATYGAMLSACALSVWWRGFRAAG